MTVSEQLPPTVQQALGAAGTPARVKWRGREWLVGHPFQKAKSELEELAAGAAIDEVLALKSALSPAAYTALWKETTAAVQAREFRTWGPGWARVVFARENAHLFLLSLLRDHQPHVTAAEAVEMMAEEPEQVQAAILRVVPDFLAYLLAGLKVNPDQQQALRVKLTEALNNSTTPPQPHIPPTP